MRGRGYFGCPLYLTPRVFLRLSNYPAPLPMSRCRPVMVIRQFDRFQAINRHSILRNRVGCLPSNAVLRPSQRIIQPENTSDHAERRRHPDGFAWLHHKHGDTGHNEQAGEHAGKTFAQHLNCRCDARPLGRERPIGFWAVNECSCRYIDPALPRRQSHPRGLSRDSYSSNRSYADRSRHPISRIARVLLVTNWSEVRTVEQIAPIWLRSTRRMLP